MRGGGDRHNLLLRALKSLWVLPWQAQVGFLGGINLNFSCVSFLFLLLELKGRAFQSPSIFLSSLDIQKRKSHSFKSHSR